MSVIEKLRYVRIGVDNPESVSAFATEVIGLQPVDAPEGIRMFRSDFRDHSLAVYQSDSHEQALALEVRDKEALDQLANQLTAAGYKVRIGSTEECSARKCKSMISFDIRGNVRLEVVVRPQDSGWRYFGTRDAGITEFFGVAFSSTDIVADVHLWTDILGGKVSDYVGEATYIALDDEHHRIAIHPSDRDCILEAQFKVEGLDQLMQNKYFLEISQIAIVQGPGRRPTSEQLFVTCKGPCPMLFGLVSEGTRFPFEQDRRPRQFPRHPLSFCAWGSTSTIPEFSAGQA